MTTTVVISSPEPNHQKVGVQVVYPAALGHPAHSAGRQIVLDDGESTVVYVHGGAEVVVTEIPRDTESTPA